MLVARLCSFTKSFQILLDNGIANDLPWLLPGMHIRIKNILIQYFSTKKSSLAEKSGKPFKITETKDGTLVKKKMFSTPKIWLVDENGSKKSIYLEQAEKLAKHEGLQLIQLTANSVKPLYKIVKCSQAEDFLDKKKNGKCKRFIIKTGMLDNDLNSKIKQMIKLLGKGNEITIEIFTQQSTAGKLDELIDKFKKEIGCKHNLSGTSLKKNITILKFLPNNSTKEKENTEEKTS